ncbi:MAG: acyltransferase family protein [Bacteroidales bacterium]|nr:acyltransferase family protein [Bacteroidales bacterium]
MDYARVFAALLVIYGHVLPYDSNIRTFIYAFHMPFFFIVSGMLHKYRGCIDWKKYFRTLIVPAIFFNLLLWIVTTPFFYYGNWDYEARYHSPIADSLMKTYFESAIIGLKAIVMGRGGAPSGPCWFLFALFFCKIGTDMCKKYSWKIMLVPFLALFVACTLTRYNFFCIGNAMMAMPFFISGHYLGKHLNEYIEKAGTGFKVCMALVFFILTVLLICLNGKVSMWGRSYGTAPVPVNFALFHINAIIGSVMLLLLSSLFKMSSTLFTSLAGSLITILGLQVLFIYVLWYDYPALTTPIPGLIMSVVILFACHIIHKLLQRFIPCVVGKQSK